MNRTFAYFTITVLLSLGFIAVPYQLESQNAGDNIFDNSYLHQINITASTSFESLEFGGDYFMASIEIDGIVLDSVAIKPKGFLSILVSDQKPLRVDLNKFIEDIEYDGIKKFNLNNNLDDVQLQRENIAYLLDRRAGYPGSRTSYAEVNYNNEFVGIYGIVQQVDKTFLSQYFADDEGDLYKGSLVPEQFEVDVKEGTIDNYLEYKALATAENIDEYVHFRNYLKYMAVQILIGDWDSYPYDRHNYYIYHEPKSSLLNFIPWDHNFAFYGSSSESIYPARDVDIVRDESNIEYYHQTLCELLDYLLDETYVNDQIDHNYDILNTNSFDVDIEDPASLKEFIQERKENFRTMLLEEGVVCESFAYPFQIGDIVINEFVASNDEQGGVQEPDGGSPDWIELYNNTNDDIELDEKFYLSDDKDFLKKWYFPEASIIPANGYLIVWSDRDVHQQGIHSNFKISKKGGDLFMVYEDLTIIDHVNYSEQQLNQGYARVPNGNGDFVIQNHTFNSNNNVPLVVIDGTYISELNLFPNPNDGLFWIDTPRRVEQLFIYNSIGQIQYHIESPAFPIDVSKLSSGLYFVKVEIDSQQTKMHKFRKK